MKPNETNNNELNLMEDAEIDVVELENIATALPVRSGLQAGRGLIPCL